MTAEARVSVDLFLLCGQVDRLRAAEVLRRAVDYARAAEDAGFDAVWLAEHHFITYGVCPSAVTFAGYLLGATSRIQIGTAAAILSNRNPVALAEEAILLDIVSSGRFLLGVGRGGPWIDLDVFGTGLARYESGFTESLDELLGILAGGSPAGFPGVPIVPAPIRPVPVWVAATSPATAQLAAARGLPLLVGMHEEPSALLAAYAEVNPSPVPHASAHLVSAGDVRSRLLGWAGRTREYRRLADAPSASRDVGAYVDRLLRLHPPGTPEAVAERIAASAATTGVRRVLLVADLLDGTETLLALRKAFDSLLSV